MDNDTTEQLIGFGLVILFGVALVWWPPLAELVDRYAIAHLRVFCSFRAAEFAESAAGSVLATVT